MRRREFPPGDKAVPAYRLLQCNVERAFARLEELETKVSQLFDQDSDDQTLDVAAEILAKAERLKDPLDKSKAEQKPDSDKGADKVG